MYAVLMYANPAETKAMSTADIQTVFRKHHARLEAVAATNPQRRPLPHHRQPFSHKSPPILDWLARHPRLHQVFIPTGAVEVVQDSVEEQGADASAAVAMPVL